MFTGKRAHRNPRNLFVLNLVISGLLTSVLCLPPTLLQCLRTGQWSLGVAACKIVPAIQGECDDNINDNKNIYSHTKIKQERDLLKALSSIFTS